MAGVIDEKGIQWERCNCCAKWVRLDNLGYLPPDSANESGHDLCIACVNKLDQVQLGRVIPAASWLPQFGD